MGSRPRTPTKKKKRPTGGRTPPPATLPAVTGWAWAATLVLEWVALTVAALAAAGWVFGQAFFLAWTLSPPWVRLLTSAAFAGGTAVAVVAAWSILRTYGERLHRLVPFGFAALLAVTGARAVTRDQKAHAAYEELRRLLSSRTESERERIAHQVYAAYRRARHEELAQILQRAEPYLGAIEEAAGRFGIPTELLVGVAATESSFLPRTSKDGGRGLFQLTAVPEPARRVAERVARVRTLDLDDPRHNAFVAAATLRYYWQQQNGDLFLALLAYNIGPRNGGLLEIMHRYGAKDFLTIQPYLQNLPADYPIRVLSAALAFRVWRHYGQLLRYEVGNNAREIQALGVPGLDP
ncbi:MAG: hypothetical protein KatS3mg077_2293 [Candidatus Binatia bacterium]|nr:MAG: hypothetical protein KatS3mg077_2293 [Candidatus Binatia bacterium]